MSMPLRDSCCEVASVIINGAILRLEGDRPGTTLTHPVREGMETRECGGHVGVSLARPEEFCVHGKHQALSSPP
jgi:hypothetical protein